MKRVSYEEVVVAVVQYKDDPRYNSRCLYTDPETGRHCLVGQILVDLGGTLPPVDRRIINDRAIDTLREDWDYGLNIDPYGITILTRLQSIADFGESWSNAIKMVNDEMLGGV